MGPLAEWGSACDLRNRCRASRGPGCFAVRWENAGDAENASVLRARSVMESKMLKVRNLYKRFETNQGGVRAVQGVDFEVKEGSFFTLLGPSGCGKTTTLRCVA